MLKIVTGIESCSITLLISLQIVDFPAADSPVILIKNLLSGLFINLFEKRDIKFGLTSRKIGIEYSQFEELEMFSRFATKLDDETQKIIDRGNLIREVFKQAKYNTISIEGQIAIFICINNNILDNIDLDKINEVEKDIVQLMENHFGDLVKTIRSNNELSEGQINRFIEKAKETVAKYKTI